MSDKFGWCFIGCGKIANRVLNDILRYSNGACLSAVYSRNAERAKAFADKYNAKVYETAEEAIMDPNVRAVYVCTTNPSHMMYSLLSIKLGKPVLCEKPAALNLNEAREIVGAARAKGVYYMEGMWMRHNPIMKKVITWVQEGAIGKARSISASFAIPFPYNPTYRLFDPAQGGGALLDIGVYVLAFSCFIFSAMPERISAFTDYTLSGVDGSTACIFRYPDGAVARLYFGVTTDEPNEACIAGDAGFIHIPHRFWAPGKAYLHANGQAEQVYAPNIEGGLQFEFDAARADIEAGRTENALMTHDLTLRIMELVDKIKSSTYPQR